MLFHPLSDKRLCFTHPGDSFFSGAALTELGLRELALLSAASLSKKSDQSSDKVSLLALCSINDVSALSAEVLGFLLNGVSGTRSVEDTVAVFVPPGLESPAFSRCSKLNQKMSYDG
jgi:hypothetical protein